MDTPDNFNYGNMTADFRMKYKKMMEDKNKKKVNFRDISDYISGMTDR